MVGCPKLARLRILKASARNCKFHLSLMRIVLNSEVSNSVRFGPRNWLRPAFPNVPATGSRKALGLNHWLRVPRMTGPLKAGFRLGTSGLAVSPDPERFEPTFVVKGKPDCVVRKPLHCEPPINRITSPQEPLSNRCTQPK